MDADRRALALVILDLITGNERDDVLASKAGDHEAVASGAAYLAGFAIEALALERRESVPTTVAFLRQALGDVEGDDGLGGVREPLQPRPSPSGAAAHADEK